MFEVLDAGPLTTVQDLGRPGWAHLGVPRSGAADRGALKLANRLVGNDEGCAGLEATLRGPTLRAMSRCIVSLTGGVADAHVDGSDVGMNAPIPLRPGAVLAVGSVVTGLRTYIAFAGGIDARLTLGSRSTDTLGGIGPLPLKRGDRFQLLDPVGPAPALDAVPVPQPLTDLEVTLLLGPRDDWIEAAALASLSGATYVVDANSNRVGVRLDGPLLPWARRGELRSEGVVSGSVQVPPSGHPMILLVDHPTTGGYPVAGVVASANLDRVAQLRPGNRIRFCPHRAALEG